jgi:hypothetical protein
MVFLMFPCNYLTTLPAQKDGIIIKAKAGVVPANQNILSTVLTTRRDSLAI